MPVIQIKTNCTISDPARQEMLSELVETVAGLLDKPKNIVMLTYSVEEILMAGSMEPAMYVDIRYISKESAVTKKDIVCDEVLNIIRKYVTIAPERVMMFISTVPAEHAWKYSGRQGGN